MLGNTEIKAMIEVLRDQLNELTQNLDIHAKQVMDLSHEIDVLVVKYQRSLK